MVRSFPLSADAASHVILGQQKMFLRLGGHRCEPGAAWGQSKSLGALVVCDRRFVTGQRLSLLLRLWPLFSLLLVFRFCLCCCFCVRLLLLLVWLGILIGSWLLAHGLYSWCFWGLLHLHLCFACCRPSHWCPRAASTTRCWCFWLRCGDIFHGFSHCSGTTCPRSCRTVYLLNTSNSAATQKSNTIQVQNSLKRKITQSVKYKALVLRMEVQRHVQCNLYIYVYTICTLAQGSSD